MDWNYIIGVKRGIFIYRHLQIQKVKQGVKKLLLKIKTTIAMIRIFKDIDSISEEVLKELGELTLRIKKRTINIAISGGSTPKKMFEYFTNKYGKALLFQRFDIWWVDERCVPSDDDECNFKWANELWISPSGISMSNVHRIIGENDPNKEAKRYSDEIVHHVQEFRGLPQFDLILLGMGDDGHTASIFPDRIDLFSSDKICEVTEHPTKNQKRITLTGTVINNSTKVIFIVTGKDKASIIRKTAFASIKDYPASNVKPEWGELFWFIDEAATTKKE